MTEAIHVVVVAFRILLDGDPSHHPLHVGMVRVHAAVDHRHQDTPASSPLEGRMLR